MNTAKIVSTRLLETFIIAGVVLGGVILVLQSDIEHIKADVTESKADNRAWYKELRNNDRALRDELYKHGH